MESSAVHVARAQFRGATDAVWALPAHGQTSRVSLALRVTNDGPDPRQLNLFDTLQVQLYSADGAALRYRAARDATARAGRFSPVLAPGQTFALSRPATLEWQASGTLRLSGPDGFGGVWWFDGLGAGGYSVGLAYQNDTAKTDNGSPLWCGTVRTPLLSIRIE